MAYMVLKILLGDSDNTLVNAASVYELPECSLQCGDIPVNLTEAVWDMGEVDGGGETLYPFISEFSGWGWNFFFFIALEFRLWEF